MPRRSDSDALATLIPLRSPETAHASSVPVARHRGRRGVGLSVLDARTPDDVAGEDVLWFVTVSVAGPAADPAEVREALERLSAKQAFVASARFSADRAEVRYWDEADTIAVVIAQGLRMWADNESTIGLPGWSVVGLEVVDRDTTRLRWEREDHPQVLVLGEIRPFEETEPR